MATVYSKTGLFEVSRIASALFSSVGSPYALERLEALHRGEYGSAMPTPTAYSDAASFGYDYACHTFLKKLKIHGDVQRLTEKALEDFKVLESSICLTNRRLRYHATNVEGPLSVARRKIADILGRFDVNAMAAASGWGPGATATLTSRESTVDRKVLEPRLSVSPRALKYAAAVLNSDNVWQSARLGLDISGPTSLLNPFEVVLHSRWTTVDKDWKQRRAIDIQPTMNLFLQKGVGELIRRKLKRCGINLDDQSRNQYLASVALREQLATIDLASASDSIPSELVYLLLPPDWYEVLRDLRTDFTMFEDGQTHYLHKFSAMGNGYTFELESLIFYALAWSIVRVEHDDATTPIGVYGDDIVVGQHHAPRLVEVLEEVGFTVNRDKTYLSGDFYESCGKHYFKGVDVTPIYQKEGVSDISSAIRCANRIYRWALRMGLDIFLDDVAYKPWLIAYGLAAQMHYKWAARRLSSKGRPVSNMNLRLYPLPTQPCWVESDGGLLGISDTVQCTRWFTTPHSRNSVSEYALLSLALRQGVGDRATYGLVNVRSDGKKQYGRISYPLTQHRGAKWNRLRTNQP